MTRIEADAERKAAMSVLREARGIPKAEYERRRRAIEVAYDDRIVRLARRDDRSSRSAPGCKPVTGS